MGDKVVVKKETLHRLAKDIKEAVKNEHSNIIYKHDEENILKGYAIIFGPEDTPYEYGNYMYKFEFPIDYPFSPPKVTYLTNDGITRFHPNFYKNGTCCLSILNTWKGEPWTSCQTIMSVLLSISTFFQKMPLLLEPGVTKNHPDLIGYTHIITYKNYAFSILDVYTLTKNIKLTEQHQNDMLECCKYFSHDITKNFEKNKMQIIFNVEKLEKSSENKTCIQTSLYKMNIRIDYTTILEKLKSK